MHITSPNCRMCRTCAPDTTLEVAPIVSTKARRANEEAPRTNPTPTRPSLRYCRSGNSTRSAAPAPKLANGRSGRSDELMLARHLWSCGGTNTQQHDGKFNRRAHQGAMRVRVCVYVCMYVCVCVCVCVCTCLGEGDMGGYDGPACPTWYCVTSCAHADPRISPSWSHLRVTSWRVTVQGQTHPPGRERRMPTPTPTLSSDDEPLHRGTSAGAQRQMKAFDGDLRVIARHTAKAKQKQNKTNRHNMSSEPASHQGTVITSPNDTKTHTAHQRIPATATAVPIVPDASTPPSGPATVLSRPPCAGCSPT